MMTKGPEGVKAPQALSTAWLAVLKPESRARCRLHNSPKPGALHLFLWSPAAPLEVLEVAPEVSPQPPVCGMNQSLALRVE